MTRVEALEAVAEAAREWLNAQTPKTRDRAYRAMTAAIRALDALPAAPAPTQGETVEVVGNIWRNSKTGALNAVTVEDDDPEEYDNEGWRHIATITASVPLPTIPTIRATVATEGGGK